MATQRTHIVLSTDLLDRVDKLVGPRGRSAFFEKVADEELRKQSLLEFLDSKGPLWDLSKHPELKRGSAAWVRKLRRESETSHQRRMKR